MKCLLFAGCCALLACSPAGQPTYSIGPDAGLEAGTDGGADGSPATAAMPRVSGGVPTFASSTNFGAGPANANDDNPSSAWEPSGLPAWIAYDLSGIPQAQRQENLIAWYAPRTQDYINAPQPWQKIPIDYTLEINAAPGGGSSPPATGWTQVAAVTGNDRSSRQHLVPLAGANWLRMSISRGSDPNLVDIDLDVHSAPAGASDAWLFMGDSITAISLPRALSDLPALVAQAQPGFYPAVIDAAIGGTSTATAAGVIDDTMSTFPGRYVVLAYGTNDDPANFRMEDLVLKVFAAGKVPVIPHMPWSDTTNVQQRGPGFNAAIEALYVKYPQIVRGPDLWAFFNNRTDLIPSGDVHPNAAGQEELRKQWAARMAQLDR